MVIMINIQPYLELLKYSVLLIVRPGGVGKVGEGGRVHWQFIRFNNHRSGSSESISRSSGQLLAWLLSVLHSCLIPFLVFQPSAIIKTKCLAVEF